MREITLGYGVQLGANAIARVDLVGRDWRDFYATRVDQSTPKEADFLGISQDIQIIENTDDITREYRGVHFQTNWRPRRFNLGLNYTYSTLKGNDEQESAVSGTVGNNPGSIYYREVTDFAQNLPIGYLDQDQRHRVRSWIGYDVPMPRFLGALNIFLLQNFHSGTPFGAVQLIELTEVAEADNLLRNTNYTAPESRREPENSLPPDRRRPAPATPTQPSKETIKVKALRPPPPQTRRCSIRNTSVTSAGCQSDLLTAMSAIG